ncbi:MAG: glutamate--tRNA ligase, partial [Candidatus Puniceispirillales bacterium]
MKIVTRFAPSPTGYLHIGGARTAIFNYLFAKKHNGKYLVRIEDTDTKRSTNEAVDAIHDGLNWLGINSSEKIIYQSKNFKSHVKVAYELLEKGFAYKCFLNPEELNLLRIKSRENGIPIKSPWRNNKSTSENKEFVIRLKMPLTGTTTINDYVQGKVSVKNEILDDMIILRSDKTPTYMLSSVVDDKEMGITHIIRGDDHFNNAFRQIQIINFLNWDKPLYAHIPLIHGTDGSKLSKRHGATNLIDYHNMGYTSEAMFSYLLQLGWTSRDDDYEFNKAVNLFALENINKSPAKFDVKKLNNINSRYLKNMDTNNIYKLIIERFELILNIHQERRLKSLLPELLKRVDVYVDLKDDFEWIIEDNFLCKDENKLKQLKENNLVINEIGDLLKKCEWTKEAIDHCLKTY